MLKDNNWDGYFTKFQLDFYRKLYETEFYDREEIGEGSYGKVFQGFDEEEGKLIAIKQIDISKLNSKSLQDLNSVEMEIEILSKLSHKNIVKYYGVVRSEKYLEILLQYCIGGSISKILNTYKRLSEAIIRKYTIQILEGLEYLHCHNIVHGDIKGANILVDRDGTCKLTDFGGAKIVKDGIDLKKNSFKGTPNWMAPETVKTLENTRFSDIWSLGCTLIEMATGNPPWVQHKNPMTVLYTLYNIKEPPRLPENVSKDLKDFISRCLKIESKDRWNVYQLLRHPFITGDATVPDKKNIENENKFDSDDKSARILDSIHLSTSERKLIKTNTQKTNDMIEPSNILIKTSKISPIPKRKITEEKIFELVSNGSNMNLDWKVLQTLKNVPQN